MIRVYEPIGQIYGVTSRTQRLIQKYQDFFIFIKEIRIEALN